VIVASEDVLDPTIMQAAMQLWNQIQNMTVDGGVNYPSLCVKFPITEEFASTLSTLLSKNETE
jgi:hypothetical protein